MALISFLPFFIASFLHPGEGGSVLERWRNEDHQFLSSRPKLARYLDGLWDTFGTHATITFPPEDPTAAYLAEGRGTNHEEV